MKLSIVKTYTVNAIGLAGRLYVLYFRLFHMSFSVRNFSINIPGHCLFDL